MAVAKPLLKDGVPSWGAVVHDHERIVRRRIHHHKPSKEDSVPTDIASGGLPVADTSGATTSSMLEREPGVLASYRSWRKTDIGVRAGWKASKRCEIDPSCWSLSSARCSDRYITDLGLRPMKVLLPSAMSTLPRIHQKERTLGSVRTLELTRRSGAPGEWHHQAVATVSGWIWEKSLERALLTNSSYLGYVFDGSDWDAVGQAIGGTDDDDPNGWYSYPLTGDVPVEVQMARAVGDGIIQVKVLGDLDQIAIARLEVVLDLL
jgi:hypothetical protein